MNSKIVVIGLDGATWTVLDRWLQDGSLPNLAKLKARGSWGELRSTIPPLTAPAWSSFLTGKNPGNHGVFHFIPLDDDPVEGGDGKIEVVDSRSIQSATLWDILGHHNRQVGVVNVPMSYPPRPVNGFMITCLLTPPGAKVFTYPPDLSKQLDGYQIDLDRFMDQKPFARDLAGNKMKREVKPSLQLMHEFSAMEEKRAQTVLELMGTRPWDVFMVVFTATDRMGHYLWPYHLPAPEEESGEDQEIRTAVHQFYKRLDENIGAIIEKAGTDASILVMSDHGMGPIYTRNTHWNNWLYKKGYLKIEGNSASTPDGWLLRLGIPRDKIRQIVRKLPFLSQAKWVQKARQAPSARIDHAHSRAYYVRIFDPVGGFHIQAEGEEREKLINELMDAARQVVDPATGKTIVRWIFRREECFQGPYADKAPDVILVMHPDYGSSDRLSNYSAIVSERPSIGDPGGHHIEGIFMAAGPEILARPEPLEDLRIEDVAPTLLHLAGLPVPTDMDGMVIEEIFNPLKSRQIEPVKGPVLSRWPSDAAAQPILEESAEGEEIIQDRLRALGYIE